MTIKTCDFCGGGEPFKTKGGFEWEKVKLKVLAIELSDHYDICEHCEMRLAQVADQKAWKRMGLPTGCTGLLPESAEEV